MVRLLAVITSICLLAGLVGPPILHAWESGRKSHEFSFMATLGGEPVRWNPCEPIHYVVNLGAAPAGSCKTSRTPCSASRARRASRSCTTG